MKKLYLSALILFLAFYKPRAQCSVNITASQPQLTCSVQTISLTAVPSTTLSAAAAIAYSWDKNGGAAGTRDVTDSGLYTVTITVTDNSTSPQTICTSSASIYITKNTTPPTVSALAVPNTICFGDSSTLIALGAVHYSWQPGPLKDTAVVRVGPGSTTTYTVTGTAANDCPANATVTVTVNPLPTAGISGSTEVCQNAAQPGITFTGTGGTPPFTFGFTVNNNASLQQVSTGQNNMVTVGASTVLPGAFTYRLVSVSDGNGCRQLQTGTETITVHETARLTSDKTASVCDSALFSYMATSSVPGTAFGWERDTVTGIKNPYLAMPTAGISEALDDTTAHPVTVRYAYTLTTGINCKSTDTVRVTVNPTPVLDSIPTATFCNGTSSPGFTFKTSTPNASFTWTNNNINIGLPASGSNSIPAFVATNMGNRTDSALINVFISANGCSGKPRTFKIIVGPGPSLTGSNVKSICNNTAVGYRAVSSSPQTKFSWTRAFVPGISNPAGSGSTDTIAETLHNTTPDTVTVQYVFTLSTGGVCSDTAIVKVTVNPTPVPDFIPDAKFCNGDSSAGFTFHTASPNPSYTWTNNNIKIGLPANGTGAISSFIATNNSSLSDSATVTVTASVKADAATCTGPSGTFKIRVSPSPVRPDFTSLSGSPGRPSSYPATETLDLCSGAQNINFNVNAPNDSTRYLWSSVLQNGLTPAIRDTAHANTVISFTDPGDYRIRVTALKPGTGCSDTVSQYVRVGRGLVQATGRIFPMQPGDLLVYPDNSLKAYQWGYDSILNRPAFGPPRIFPGQVRQFFIPSSKLDTSKYLYWVFLQDAQDCKTRVYYNGPYANRMAQPAAIGSTVELQLFPNPNRGSFEMVLRGNIYGKMEAKIYDALGHVVARKSFLKTVAEIRENFSPDPLPDGLYYVEVLGGDLKKVVTRFVIRH